MDVLIDTARTRPVDSAGGTSETVRILLVDDDARSALTIGEMLRATWVEGLVLSHTERLRDATAELLDRGANCVLLDLSLPGADQLGAIEQVRSAAPEVPIVVLAERADAAMALGTIRAGAQDYLLKSQLFAGRLANAVRYAIERKRYQSRLAHLALHDSLTGLPNRALFLDRLGVALDRSCRTSGALAVLFLDVDNFKHVNDSLGHDAGDRVLKELAERLRSMLRPMDSVARFGGDEFTFLIEDLASEREVVLITERISHAASRPIVLGDGETSVTVSIGIALVADPRIAPDAVIRDADAAMYRAKELGQARYELFDEASRKRAIDRLELEAALRHALERSELRLDYQPVIGLDGGAGPVALEALLRWDHPQRGPLLPGEFIGLAEDTGLALPIGRYVLEQASLALARWRSVGPRLTVSVNVSARQLGDGALAAVVTSAVRAAGLDPGALCVELSERVLTDSPDIARRAIEALKATGVRIAIDDFGAGSASLRELRHLPVDTLKLDRSLIAGLGHDQQDAAILAAVLELGHALGAEIIAKGVERDAQLAELRALGCDAAQGFLLGPPLGEPEVATMLGC